MWKLVLAILSAAVLFYGGKCYFDMAFVLILDGHYIIGAALLPPAMATAFAAGAALASHLLDIADGGRK